MLKMDVGIMVFHPHTFFGMSCEGKKIPRPSARARVRPQGLTAEKIKEIIIVRRMTRTAAYAAHAPKIGTIRGFPSECDTAVTDGRTTKLNSNARV